MENSNRRMFFLLGVIIFILVLGIIAQQTFFREEFSRSQAVVVTPASTPVVSPTTAPKVNKTKKPAPTGTPIEKKTLGVVIGPCRNVPILMYHHIDDKSGSLFVSTSAFAGQMDYLVKKGYTTVTLQDVMANLNSGQALPAKPVVITFDDGYEDNYLNAYPILSSRGLKATIFVITQLVGGGDYLTWGQIQEMVNSSVITAGDHTLSHKPLASLAVDRVKDEIFSSKNILEEKLGRTINVFAYPYGSKSTEAEKYLRQAGFAAAVLNRRGYVCSGNPYELGRVRVGNSSLSTYGL